MTENQLPTEVEIKHFTFEYTRPSESLSRQITVQAKNEERAVVLAEEELEDELGDEAFEILLSLVSTRTEMVSTED